MAGLRAGSAYIDIVPKVGKDFDAALNRDVEGPAKRTGMNLGKVIGAVGGIALASKAVSFFGDAISGARESNKVAAQTEAVIKSTGGAAGVSAKQIDSYASSIAAKTGIDDEAIATGENLLLTFTNIKDAAGAGNDIFKQTTDIMVDMSAALGTDAKGSAIQLGKALNDPIKGVTALTKVGVSFTQQQKDQIKTLVESGDTLGAQKVILGELNKEFGGSAEAVATPAGKMKVAFGNLQESIGKLIVPLVDKLLPVLVKLATFLGEHQGVVLAFAAVVGTALVAAFVSWAASAASAAFFTIAAAAPMIALVAAIAAVGAAIFLLVTHWDEVWTKIKEIVGAAWQAISGAVTGGIGALLGWFKELPGKILGALGDLGKLLVDVGKSVLRGLLDGIKLYFEVVKLFYVDLPLKILGFFLDAGKWLIDVGGKIISGLWGGIKEVWNREVRFWTEVVPGVFGGIIGFVKELPGKIASAAAGMWDGIKDAFRSAVNFIIDAWNRLEFKIPGFKIGPVGYSGFTLGMPNIPRLHAGGSVVAGGLVNIRPGEEVVNLPTGATVTPDAITGRAAGVVIENLNVAGHIWTTRDLIAELGDGLVAELRRQGISAA